MTIAGVPSDKRGYPFVKTQLKEIEMEYQKVRYLITIGLAWLPWAFFNEKILGNVFFPDNRIMLFIPILAWLCCFPVWLMHEKSKSSLGIDDVFGFIGYGFCALGILMALGKVVVAIFG